ncbi:MAG: ATP-NAD kinase family protein [Idiomarina sp.]|nr:ATP-NAD kinase family protein [Idiomarina sp.]
MFKIGLVINPFAGIGGAVGLKGSDGAQTREEALAKGAEQKAAQRAAEALAMLADDTADISWLTAAGAMGADTLSNLGYQHHVVYQSVGEQSESADTQSAVQAMLDAGIDLLVFAGGDGTARDVCAVIGDQLPVVGIPAGVKIHSGVYAVSPRGAGRVLEQLVSGQLTSVRHADVMDIDEDAFREGTVRARRYGEMLVPKELEYMQAVKMGGIESDELVLTDIADDIFERMEDDTLYVMGSGTTVAAVMDNLGLENTLLGVDAVVNEELVGSDLTAQALELLLTEYQHAYLVITLIGGQGHLFGRGNQQLSPAVIRKIGRERIIVVATKTKLKALNGRPLQVDTGDSDLDQALSGFIQVTTGYHDRTMVAVKAVE